MASSAWNDFSREKNDLLSRVFEQSNPNKERIREAIYGIYRGAGLVAGRIEVAEGPAHALALLQDCSNRDPHLRKRNVADRLFALAIDSAKRLRAEMASSISADDYVSLRNMFFWDLNFQISRSFAEPVFMELLKSSACGPLAKFRQANNPSISDFDWMGLYLASNKYLGMQLALPEGMAAFVFNGGMQLYAFDQVAIAYCNPVRICRDDSYRLHGEEAPAVVWHDGTKLYFHHGVAVPAKLVETPGAITREDIMAENNAEVRRCYQEIMGSERFAHMLGLKLLDAQQDRLGNDIKLFRTEFIDKLAGAHIYFAQVVCPSTGRKYFLCVPPKVKSAPEAVAWTFGKSTDDYLPEIET